MSEVINAAELYFICDLKIQYTLALYSCKNDLNTNIDKMLTSEEKTNHKIFI